MGDVMDNFMNVEDLEATLEKIDMYRKDLTTLSDKIYSSFQRMNYSYKGDYTADFQDKIKMIYHNMGVFNQYNEKQVNEIQKSIQVYVETKEKVNSMFNEI